VGACQVILEVVAFLASRPGAKGVISVRGTPHYSAH
jgi:hypothetical protein